MHLERVEGTGAPAVAAASFSGSLGVLEVVNAVAVGVTAPLLAPHGPSMLPMTVLPLSLVPTFLVPLFLILHFICIAQARKWKAEQERFLTGTALLFLITQVISAKDIG